MSTSGSFVNASPPCPTTVFTRAALIALRNAGSLRPECHYFSLGPTIGTAGNTSPTTIEQHAVSATELSLEAKVLTSFSGSAWIGTYDIDVGPSGTIFNLRDDWNNFAEDEDPSAPTVHTRVPWHRGSVNFAGNHFDSVQLPGWDTAGGDLTDNTLQGSTVNLTGMTSGLFRRNNTSDGTVIVVSTPAVTFLQNTVTDSLISLAGSGALDVTDNEVSVGTITVNAASTAAVTVRNNRIGGGYRVVLTGKTGSPFTLQDNNLFGTGLSTEEVLCTGTGDVSITHNTVNDGQIRFQGSGAAAVFRCTMNNPNLSQVAGSAGSLAVSLCTFNNASVTLGAANAAGNNVASCDLRQANLVLDGPVTAGVINAFSTVTAAGFTATVTATATAPLEINGGLFNDAAVTQSRTAGTLATRLQGCAMRGLLASVTDTGSVNPGQRNDIVGVSLADSVVSIGSLTAGRSAPTVLSHTDMQNSTVNLSSLPGSASVRDGRMLASTLNAGFDLAVFTMDGATKTLTANAANKAANPGFDNF